MSSIYDMDIYAPIENDLELFRREFVLSPELWGKFHLDDLAGIDFSNWKRVKLMDSGVFSNELSRIPTAYGGIYIFCIEPGLVPDTGCYVMYVGKATKTRSENLRARVRSYRQDMVDGVRRPRIHTLFRKWGEYVYVHYLSIDASGEIIEALEDRLISAFGVPPCNAEIRVKSVKTAIRAFR